MRQILPDVHLIEGLRSAHVYLLVSEGGLTLIDSGTAGEADQIAAQLEEGGYVLSGLRTIILTHCHSDHTGSAAELARRSGARILAHQDEVPYVEGSESLPFSSFLQRVLSWVMDRVARTVAPKVDQALQHGDVVDALGGLQVIHAPGHTPGSIALYQPARQVLFCGDVLFNGNPLTGRGAVQPPPRAFSVDPVRAEQAARRLADLPVKVICFGHGDSILEGGKEVLQEV